MKKRPLVPLASFVSGVRRALPVYPICLVLLGLTYFFALRESFDYAIGHFDTGFWYILTIVFTAVSLIASALPAYLAKNTVSADAVPENDPAALFGSVMAAVLSVILAAKSILAFQPTTSTLEKLEAYTLPFLALSVILGILPAVRGTRIHQFASLPAILSVNMSIFVCYFDPAVPLNSPVRNLTTIMQCAALLFLLSEARLTFGVGSHRITMPSYIFANAACAALTGGIALGGILSRLLNSESADPNLSLLRLGLYLALAVTAVSRLYAMPKICGPYREPPKKDGEPEEPAETGK